MSSRSERKLARAEELEREAKELDEKEVAREEEDRVPSLCVNCHEAKKTTHRVQSNSNSSRTRHSCEESDRCPAFKAGAEWKQCRAAKYGKDVGTFRYPAVCLSQ